jgi:integrase
MFVGIPIYQRQRIPTMPLSDVKIRSVKGSAKLSKLSDGEGLQLWVSPAGGRSWKLAYRLNGLQKLVTFGTYPEISLQQARDRRDEAKRQITDGIDPAQQKKIDRITKAASDAVTFSLVAAELLEKKRREGKAGATIGKRQWLYSLASDDIGSRPLMDITAPEILHVLRKVEAKGLIETAHKLRSVIGEVFRYGVATGRAVTDPTFALRGALVKKTVIHRAAILDPQEFGGLLRAIEAFQGQPTTTAALKLMALLFPRPGELRLAEWKEFDLNKAIWTIPASRTKMRREHRVPLPVQALAILNALYPVTGHAALVFPGLGSVKRPISENTLNAALRRMGYAQDEMTAHGFRAAASTLLNESGKFSADAIERALAHQDTDAIRRAYARGEHWQERVTMAQWWADYLDALRDGAKVIRMARA